MSGEFGQFALLLAFALSCAQLGLSAAGRIRRDATLAGAGEGAALGAFVAAAFAFALLMHAFVVSDFSIANVANNSRSDKPMLYKVAATWGSHEGSMLLWDLALTGFGAALAAFGTRLPGGLKASALGVQGALGVAFIGYTAFASNPFARLLDPPVEGASLNPVLQDPFLAIHPPFLYAGYVGLSVVFSLAVAALIEGRVDAAWGRWVRPWTLAAWSLLTVGITLGSFWAYYELGWGGWWFWDPVENASFMPWLAATALLHSADRDREARRADGVDGVPEPWRRSACRCWARSSCARACSPACTRLRSTPRAACCCWRSWALAAGQRVRAVRRGGRPSSTPGGLFAPVSREGDAGDEQPVPGHGDGHRAARHPLPPDPPSDDGERRSASAGPTFALTFAPLMGAGAPAPAHRAADGLEAGGR